jgi:nucleotide-binding universal stress UspA family protein
MLAEARSRLISRGITDTFTRIEEGTVVEQVLNSARATDLLVLGKRGEHADLARLPLGSNVERIVRDSNVPALVVSRAFRPVRRCLLAFDFDEASVAAIDALAVQKLVPPMPILVLHVGHKTDEIRTGMRSAAEALKAAGFEVTTEVVGGDPQRVIAERAVTDATDLVVMGAFGRSRLKSLIFGSLTSEVMRACQTPVLLTRGK